MFEHEREWVRDGESGNESWIGGVSNQKSMGTSPQRSKIGSSVAKPSGVKPLAKK